MGGRWIAGKIEKIVDYRVPCRMRSVLCRICPDPNAGAVLGWSGPIYGRCSGPSRGSRWERGLPELWTVAKDLSNQRNLNSLTFSASHHDQRSTANTSACILTSLAILEVLLAAVRQGRCLDWCHIFLLLVSPSILQPENIRYRLIALHASWHRSLTSPSCTCKLQGP